MVKVIQTFLCWLIRTCRKMSMIACRLFSGFIQIVNKQSCLIWILHKVSETTSNDLFSWSREIGWKCLSFPSFLVFHCIAMCLTVNEKKKNKNLLKIFGDFFFLQKWNWAQKKKGGQCHFPHEIIFIWWTSVKKLLSVSVQNLLILTEKNVRVNTKW